MLASERRERIAHWVDEHGQASLDELSQHFEVSTDTIRRDLNELHKAGKLRQVRGGALRHSEDPYPYQRRAIRGIEEKRLIANRASEIIPEGIVLFLDLGTTALCLAEAIAHRSDLTVVTSNLPAAVRLGEGGKVTTIVPGGQVDGAIQGLVGSATFQQLSTIHFDIAVLVPRGVSACGHLTTAANEDAQIKQLVRERADRSLLMVTANKLGVKGAFQFAELENEDTFITDAGESHSLLKSIRQNTPELELYSANISRTALTAVPDHQPHPRTEPGQSPSGKNPRSTQRPQPFAKLNY
ncbi:DeoR/GlpR family DNA-binding transcription regulator [Rhodopirellula sp. MGV]|uniref:DeoR/GlpR family DNA-binding transcription regulator n=1 Tax=Rhodopirellula sp. MGV TaxID=2023130 RepID=UPI00117AFCF8|nr:DeoR/GlpR family DNA-binding transcription regulator [Rhodopirellula sp. MGV]